MMTIEKIHIRGGRVIDPANQWDAISDVYLAEGKIITVRPATNPVDFTADRIFDASDHIVCPGFIDLCARLREPGLEHKADIASESYAAVANGITSLVLPPDTAPVIDEPAVVELIRHRSDAAAGARVYPLGALTPGLNGEQLAEMAALKEAGCIGVSNALQPIRSTLVLRRCLEYAATFDLTVFCQPQDAYLSDGCAHAGKVSARLGLAAIPSAAETTELARWLALIEDVGVQTHFNGLSSSRGTLLIERAKSDGLPISAAVNAHHLHLTEIDLERFNSLCHVIPPLRSYRDQQALRRQFGSGVLDVLCSDHQPHEAAAKEDTFSATEPGISGLDSLLGLGLKLVEDNTLSLSDLIARLSWQPGKILKLPQGHLSPQAPADLCIFKLDYPATQSWYSRGQNSPFRDWQLPGQVSYTLVAGQVVYEYSDHLSLYS